MPICPRVAVALIWMLGVSILPATESSSGNLRLDVPPRVISSPTPEYPQYLIDNMNYLRGVVVVSITLDPQGGIKHVQVVQSTHPAFIAPALTAVFQTQFSPGYSGKLPVETRFNYSISFGVKRGSQSIGLPPNLIPQKPKGLPPEFDYDAPPILASFCDAAFPRQLLLDGIKGEARVMFVVDENGLVERGEVLSATRPEFGAALLAAIETWRFLPATKHRVQIKTALVQQQEFPAGLFRHPEYEQRIIKELRRDTDKFVRVEALDHPPKLVYQVAPQYPRSFRKVQPSGEAVIEYFISREGQAALPKVVSATDPAFGWAAMTAVSQWFYEPPKVHGNPVDVRITMAFEFKPNPLAGPSASK